MKRLKKGLALFLVLCLVFGIVSNYPIGNQVEASGTETIKEIEGYENWTYSTVGLTEASYEVTGKQTYAGANFTLQHSAFSGYVKFDQAGTTSVPLTQGGYKAPLISLGSVEGKGFWDCNDQIIKFGLRTYSDGKHYLSCGIGQNTSNWWFMDDDIALNEEFLLQVTFDYIDKDGDGNKNDLFLSVWINGLATQKLIVQHNGWAMGTAQDLYVKDYVSAETPMRAYAALWGIPGTGTVGARSVNYVANTREYTKWTFSDADMKNGVTADDVATAMIEGSAFGLDSTQFEGYVNFSAASANETLESNIPYLGIGTETDFGAVKFGLITVDGQNYLACESGETICLNNKVVNPGEEILLQVAFAYVAKDDNLKNDLQINAWIDEELVTKTPIYIMDTDSLLQASIKLFGGLTEVGSYAGSIQYRSYPVELDYEEWTFSTLGFEGDTVEATSAQLYKGGELPLDGSMFSGYVKFNKAGTTSVPLTQGGYSAPLISIGSIEGKGFWECDNQIIKFGLRTYSDQKHYLSCGVGTSNWWFMDDDFDLDEEILLKVAFDYVDMDNDGNTNDMVMSVWINGNTCQKVIVQHNGWGNGTAADLYVKDYVDSEQPMRIYAALWPNQGSVIARSTEIVRKPKIVVETDLTYDLADGSDGYVLLGTGEIRVNGKTYAAGEKLTSVGTYKIEREKNNVIYKRTVHIKDTRRDAIQIPALTYDVLGGEEVMPIIGHYIPWAKTYSLADGTTQSINFTTDKYYQLAREAGINLVAYTETDASNETAVLKQLRLAEKYNMGMYVQDKTLWTMAENEYWNRLAKYGDYNSFLGINVLDEPGIADLYGSKSHINNAEDGAYKNASKILNKYANLTGYINLLPLVDKLNRTEEELSATYKNYIQQAAIEAGVKQLSFDRYISEYDWKNDSDNNYILVNSPEFYKNLSDIRSAAIQNKLPFWTYIETGDYSDAEDTYRQIEQEEMLWYVNTALAYGTKGIQYYTVVEVDTTTDVGNDGATEHGLIDCQGNKTKWYGYVQKANKQIAAVDSVLMKSNNKGVIAAGEGSYVANCLAGLPENISSTMNEYNLNSITTDDTKYGALTGVFHYFPDHTGTGYNTYYVVNSNPAETQKVTLNFNNAVTYSIVQNAKTKYVKQASSECELTIPAGEGVLVVTDIDLTRTSNTTQVVYYEDIESYRINDITGAKDYRAPEIKKDTYTDWTFNNAFDASGKLLKSATYSSYKSAQAKLNGTGLDLDGSRFSGYVNFSDASSSSVREYSASRLMFGAINGNVWTNQTIRFGLKKVEDATYLACGTVGLEGPESKGTEHIFTDKEIGVDTDVLLQVTFDYVDHDNDGAKDDLKLGVWIDGNSISSVNGTAVADNYIYINNHAKALDAQQAYVSLSIAQNASITVGSADAHKESQDYVFAGWFVDKACETPLADNVMNGGAYAKFVDSNVLSVKAQRSDDKTAIRFVSTVDSLDYAKIGFDIRCKSTNRLTEGTTVYDQIYGVLKTEILDYKPTVCSEFSKHFFTYYISGIPTDADSQRVPFIATSYWTTFDGTMVMGDTISYSVDEVIKAENAGK